MLCYGIIHLVAAENTHGLLAIASSVRVNAIASVAFVLTIKSPMHMSIKAVCVCKREIERDRTEYSTIPGRLAVAQNYKNYTIHKYSKE